MSTNRGKRMLCGLVVLLLLTAAAAGQHPAETWAFVVSGDSRNCGDVIMPAIAAGAVRDHAQFYWHLGDLRLTTNVDEDTRQAATLKNQALSIDDYHGIEWDDFIEDQIEPFGKTPFYVGIGNHETAPPKTRDQFTAQFADWLAAPRLQEQRLRDNRKWREEHLIGDFEANRKGRQLRTYFHWQQGVVDFIYLDNATAEQFDAEQMTWFDRVIQDDSRDATIRTVVVGMHKALPWSISCDHSMNESEEGQRSGQKVYEQLLELQNKSHKRVYVLASHSHFFMDGTFNTRFWRDHGGVLPGWIVGTAGAQRYRLPANKADAKASAEDTYGYLLGTVHPDGRIDFAFKPLAEDSIPAVVKARYTADFVHNTCFEGNKRLQPQPLPSSCAAVAEPVGKP